MKASHWETIAPARRQATTLLSVQGDMTLCLSTGGLIRSLPENRDNPKLLERDLTNLLLPLSYYGRSKTSVRVRSLQMELAIAPVRQSASKESFLQTLGLNLSTIEGRQTFTTMWVSDRKTGLETQQKH